MLIVKRTDVAGAWFVFHRYDDTKYSQLNGTDGFYAFGSSRQFAADSFSVEGINTNGASYVAYLFAHDTSADGLIQCGSFTGNTTVTLGWEPQFVLLKAIDSTEGWHLHDTSRGWPVSGNAARLYANSSAAEDSTAQIFPNATGFSTLIGSSSYIYLAIRRPNKPPTTGTQVFTPVTTSALGFYSTGFAVDAVITAYRAGPAFYTGDRLRGGGVLLATQTTAAESAYAGWKFDSNTGVTQTQDSRSSINWNFRRAPGFFDVVCYTGTGAARTVSHSLGVAPELIITKNRDSSQVWRVYSQTLASGKTLVLNNPNAEQAFNPYGTAPTTSVYGVGTDAEVNQSSVKYVAYLFASLPGI
jgi:hypothetical protein